MEINLYNPDNKPSWHWNIQENRLYLCYYPRMDMPDDDCLNRLFGKRQFEQIFVQTDDFGCCVSLNRWLLTQFHITKLVIERDHAPEVDDFEKCKYDIEELNAVVFTRNFVRESEYQLYLEEKKGFQELVSVLLTMESLQNTLKSLTFANYRVNGIHENIAALIKHCKSVNEITFVNMMREEFCVVNAIPDALATLRELRKLTLVGIDLRYRSWERLCEKINDVVPFNHLVLVDNVMDEKCKEMFLRFFASGMESLCTLTFSHRTAFIGFGMKQLYGVLKSNRNIKRIVLLCKPVALDDFCMQSEPFCDIHQHLNKTVIVRSKSYEDDDAFRSIVRDDQSKKKRCKIEEH